jgi:inosose dehydratase
MCIFLNYPLNIEVMPPSRRKFLRQFLGLSVMSFTTPALYPVLWKGQPISCNTYNWTTFFKREGKTWGADLDESLGEFTKSGLTAIEPAFTHPDEVARLQPFLRKYQIEMPSAYVNSTLHDIEQADRSIEVVLAIADILQESDTRILVTNPNPIQWGSRLTKDDKQIKLQTTKLNALGAALTRKNMMLAYHTHDTELMAGAKEFHHVLQNTDPDLVHFCLDAHWVFRGCGNSEIAVFDVIKMYGDRIIELHIRQSKEGIWSETFGEGDINYQKMVEIFKTRKIKPHLVIEQAVEKGTAHTMDGVAAHQISLQMVKEVFRPII